MNRRSFLGALGLTPVAGIAAAKGLVPSPTLPADGVIRVEAAAPPSGGWARRYIEARASEDGAYRSGAFFLEARGDGLSRIVMDVEKFVITDGNDGIMTIPAEA